MLAKRKARKNGAGALVIVIPDETPAGQPFHPDAVGWSLAGRLWDTTPCQCKRPERFFAETWFRQGALSEHILKAAFQRHIHIVHRDGQTEIHKAGDTVVGDAARDDAREMLQIRFDID